MLEVYRRLTDGEQTVWPSGGHGRTFLSAMSIFPRHVRSGRREDSPAGGAESVCVLWERVGIEVVRGLVHIGRALLVEFGAGLGT